MENTKRMKKFQREIYLLISPPHVSHEIYGGIHIQKAAQRTPTSFSFFRVR
jgi:hypothetical protein